MKRLETKVNDETKIVEVNSDNVLIDKKIIGVNPIDKLGFQVKSKNGNWQVDDIIALEDGYFRVEIAGYTIDVKVVDPVSMAFIGEDEQKGDVNSSMAGQISKILVNVGDKVSKGDILLIISAMKMENQISSAIDGIIKSIHVSVQDQVEAGKLLIEINPNTV